MFRLEDVEVRYSGRRALSIGRLSFGAPGLTAIVGRNGSGKSTLMRLLARELKPDAGRVRLNGAPLSSLPQSKFARAVAYLPQRLPEAPGLTARELAALGRFPWRGVFGRHGPEDRAAVEAGLVRAGAAAFADRLVDALSGGERQRVWFAMLLAQDAPILLLDEPTSALDLAHQIDALRLLRSLADESRAVVAILHDVNLAARFADRIVALKEGAVAFDDAPARLMDARTLADLFGLTVHLAPHPQGGAPVAVPA